MRVYHFLNREFGLDDIERRRIKIAHLDDLNDPFELRGPAPQHRDERKAFLTWKAELARDYGVLCFSTGWSNPVQWSHYAEKHRGLCLGFDVPDSLLSPVLYRADRWAPDLKVLQTPGAKARGAMIEILTTKYSHWRYEREQRSFIRLNDPPDATNLHFQDFGSDLQLAEVIVGSESTITRSELNAALGSLIPSVSVFKARLSFKAYTVVKQRAAKLWA